MSSAALRILMVECAGATLPAVAPTSPFGPFQLLPCAGLDEAAGRLVGERFDAVLIAARTVDARGLLTWPALSQAVGDPALLVLTTDEPGADLAVLLVQRGVQDVLPLSTDVTDALPRALRLAIERKVQERVARKSYATDLMTGLRSQNQLIEHADQLLALREREPAPMALLALRIEGLATVEARLGRESANALRRKIAVRLRVGVRASDIVASIGADVFAVLLSKFQDPQDAERVAAKLTTSLYPPFALAGREVTVAVAIGVAQSPQDGKDAAVLLRRAAGLAASAQAHGHAGFADHPQRKAADKQPAAANDDQGE
ncbi:GGDEF domain-containing protein [Piscinibacter sp.]|jgi:diguanylate cyclase (GGDEF)-like protein|uniref:GGDEF domain-containing protein n=1 Tax=Piscinibacter sp. TaxID=1903157 RepID=UPI003559D5BF